MMFRCLRALLAALFVPLYFFFLRFVTWYKTNLAARVERLKVVQWVKGLGLFHMYQEWLS